METYYIFNIKKEIYEIYKNNPKSLYKILLNLKNMKKQDINLGLSIYNEICNIINKKKIIKYINLLPVIKTKSNKYLINKNIIIINPSRIIMQTNEINEDIIYTLNNYNKNLFMCNFKKNEYYWLNEL